jgi:L-iditol 2-dehydrogenase
MEKSMKSMKAAVLHAAKDLRFEDVPRPVPQDDQCLVKIRANGLCGSDIHFFEEGKLGPFLVTKPYIPGHEAVGEIVELGKNVRKDLKPGDKVVIEPGIPCGTCPFCKGGRYNLCEDVVFLSAPPVNGTFAEYVAISGAFVHLLPDHVDDEIGALVEPAAVAAHALNRLGAKPGSSLTILGAGPIGLITLIMARAYGISEVFLVDRYKHRLEKARELGAALAIDNSDNAATEEVLAHTAGKGTRYVIDTTGSSYMCSLAPVMAKRGGSIALVGWPEQAKFIYPVEMIIEKELDVVGINRYCNVFPQIIGMIQSGQLQLGSIVSHRFKFSQVIEAFRYASENRLDTYKVIIRND